MSSDDIEFESGDTEVVQENSEEDMIKCEDQSATTTAAATAVAATSTSQQALKQLNQLTANNSNITATKVSSAGNVAVTTVNSTNLQKIEPKLPIPGTKYVYIKNGTPQSIRIGGSIANSSNASANASQPGMQKLQLVQLKNKNVVSSVPATNSPRFLLKSGSTTQKIIFSSGGGAAKIGAAGPSGTNTRTLTVSQAQQMGLILPSSKANATATASTSGSTKTLILPAASSATGNIALKNQPTILNKGMKPLQSSKFVIQSDSSADNESKVKIATSTASSSASGAAAAGPSIVKVGSSLGAGQPVRVLQGKGLQYVRVLNAIPSGNANSTASKLVNGGQQPVIVQRKIVPQQNAQIGAGGKPQQFVTKKLEVMPIGSTAKLIKKEPTTQMVKAPGAYLLNNVQKNIVTSSIDIKPVISSQNDSFEISDIKEEPIGSKKFTSRTYSLSTDRKSKSPEPNQSNLMYSTLKLPSPEPIEGIRRKHCNCTKSQCLKLYCDCFANGEFCSNCNCKECFNTLEKEDERQKAIKICLERNPHAFKPKIGKAQNQSDTLRRHTKGCNCKRSGCLKNYCECYEAKIVCSANCKCIGCRNIDDHMDNNDRDSSNFEMSQTIKRTYEQRDEKIKMEPIVPAKKPCNFITPDVIEATVQCIIAQADDCLKNNCDAKTSERKILEEFGRCLVEIIEFSKKNNENGDD